MFAPIVYVARKMHLSTYVTANKSQPLDSH